MQYPEIMSAKATVKHIQRVMKCSRETAIRELEVAIQEGKIHPLGEAMPEWVRKRVVLDRCSLEMILPSLPEPTRA